MADILEKIIQQKRLEVQQLRENKALVQKTASPKRSFIKKLQSAKELTIIAEFKRASPSKGIINHTVEPAAQARLYEKYGAAAISVLTDQTFFKGSFSDLQAVSEAVQVPILCKDFIIDPLQIDRAAANGANLILLIVAALAEEKLRELYRHAESLGLEVLVEVHHQKELQTALNIGSKLIGINNRDLNTFTVSLEVTEKLASQVKDAGAYLISESGLHQKEDVERVKNVGANGILVGEAFMKSHDIKQMFADFRMPLGQGARQ